ncbi:hypothetical protein MMC09_004800 [Bachmanniomyces sp. S44760]|nr:hypothetical protein [Bachmanniomyces sp. S44760]
MPSSKGKPTDPKLREEVKDKVKEQPNKDGSGKGQMAAWKKMWLSQAGKISKEYEAQGGGYENEPGSKNEPKAGAPEHKSDSKKEEEVKGSETKADGEKEDKPKANSGKKATTKKAAAEPKKEKAAPKAKKEKKAPAEGTRKSTRNAGTKRSAPDYTEAKEEKAPKKAKTGKK